MALGNFTSPGIPPFLGDQVVWQVHTHRVPNGKPARQPTPTPTPVPNASPTPSATPTPVPLKEATNDGVVVLVGDSDFAYDQIAGQAQQVLNQVVFRPNNGNLNLSKAVLNCWPAIRI